MKAKLSFLQFVLFSVLLVKSAYAAPKKYKVAVQKTSVVTSQKTIPVIATPSLVNLEVMGGLTGSENLTGFAGGIGIQFSISEMFSVGPEILYLQKAGQFTTNGQAYNLTLHSLEIPLLAKLKFGSSAAKIEFFAGPSFGLAVNNDGVPENLKDSVDPSALDISLHAGAGVRFNLSGNTSIFANGRYIKSFSNPNQYEQPQINSSGILFMTGLSFGL